MEADERTRDEFNNQFDENDDFDMEQMSQYQNYSTSSWEELEESYKNL